MQALIFVHVVAMALFWLLAIALLGPGANPDSRVARLMDHPVGGSLLFGALLALGAGIGWVGLYTDTPALVLDWTGQLWQAGSRLTSVAAASAYMASLVIASFAAAGMVGFVGCALCWEAWDALPSRARTRTTG
jgi:hypothetical protein